MRRSFGFGSNVPGVYEVANGMDELKGVGNDDSPTNIRFSLQVVIVKFKTRIDLQTQLTMFRLIAMQHGHFWT